MGGGGPAGSPRASVLHGHPRRDRPRGVLAAHRPGDPGGGRVRLVIVPGPEASVIEAVVSLPDGEVVDGPSGGIRPALLFDDSYRAIDRPPRAIRVAGGRPARHHRLRQGADRSLADRQLRQPVRGGPPDRPVPRRTTGRSPTDNGYARPFEGVLATVDAARGEVLEVLDLGVVPLPEGRGSYLPEDNQPLGPTSVRWTSCSRRGSASSSRGTCSPGSGGR